MPRRPRRQRGLLAVVRVRVGQRPGEARGRAVALDRREPEALDAAAADVLLGVVEPGEQRLQAGRELRERPLRADDVALELVHQRVDRRRIADLAEHVGDVVGQRRPRPRPAAWRCPAAAPRGPRPAPARPPGPGSRACPWSARAWAGSSARRRCGCSRGAPRAASRAARRHRRPPSPDRSPRSARACGPRACARTSPRPAPRARRRPASARCRARARPPVRSPTRPARPAARA